MNDSTASEIALVSKPYHFRLVTIYYKISTLHRFRDITTFTVYTIACDFKKFSSFHMTSQIIEVIIMLFRFICKHILDNASYIV